MFTNLRQRLFDLSAALSLVLCLVFGGLWARSLGHFELVHCRYSLWRQSDDLHRYSGVFAWYSNTLRIEVTSQPLGPAYFQSLTAASAQAHRAQNPAGLQWAFVSEDRTLEMNGYPEGFAARHITYGAPLFPGDHYIFAVRPWLLTLLAAVLPFAWLIHHRRRQGTLWRFGLHELFVATTVVAALLAGGLWLMH